ncbi:unnamed protein product [Boreogadus saida]
MVVNHFGSEWIENSKRVLFELCPNTQRNVTHKVDIRQCLCVIEKPGTSGVAAPTPLAREGNQAGGSWETSSRGSDSETPAPDRTSTAAMGATNANGAVVTVSPKWTRVVKEGHRLKHATGKSPMPKKTSGIVGTGAGGSIQAVTTKSVSVFATRFSPDLEPDSLASYLKEKLGRDVTCEKIDTVQTRFSSFKITAVCREVGEMYEPQLWPEGTFVRHFFEEEGNSSTTEQAECVEAGPISAAAEHDSEEGVMEEEENLCKAPLLKRKQAGEACGSKSKARKPAASREQEEEQIDTDSECSDEETV